MFVYQTWTMLHRYLFFALLLFSASVSAQEVLRGTVRDSLSQEAVAFATVYLDGTSTGEVTGDDGSFSLAVKTSIRPLTVVISHLNYKTITVYLNDLSRPFGILLAPRSNTLTRIELADKNQRQKNIKEFHRRLIGSDSWGKNAKMLNDEVLFFSRDRVGQDVKVHRESFRPILVKRKLDDAEWSADSSQLTYQKAINLKAKSEGPLRIHLPDVGYLLQIDLKTFIADYPSGQTAYLGTSFFTSYDDLSPKDMKKLRKKRERAYWGSQMHFGRSLIANELSRNGFGVVEIIKEDKFGGQPETAPINLVHFLRKQQDGTYVLAGLTGRKFAILYFGGSRNRPLPTFRRKGGEPLQSRLLLNGNAVIYPDGTSGDTNMVFSGDIGNRGLAWWLPSDYEPPYVD